MITLKSRKAVGLNQRMKGFWRPKNPPQRIFMTAEIVMDDPEAGLTHSMLPETKVKNRRRSRISFTNEKGKAVCRIHANDITAMKAAVNAVLQIMSVYQKTKEMIKNGNNT